MATKKLIEVALPLEKINIESAREKSIRFGHPSTLHLWWARRPLAAARAVIWASLVDDPASHPEQFPTEEEQNHERERLFKILEELVVWDNVNNANVIEAAKAEIAKATNNNPPVFLDPFAGGGAIPLEAQRLGLEAHAHDLNPVPVLINKAMIEIPPRFSSVSPVNQESQVLFKGQSNAGKIPCLATDVKYYGDLIQSRTEKEVGHLYPSVTLQSGISNKTVISWLWVRTVKCPNPACGREMPLASSFVLSTKKGRETWTEPYYAENGKLRFNVHKGKCPKEKQSVKMGRGASFKCVCCGEIADKSYIHDKFISKQVNYALMAVVTEERGKRVFLTPTEEQINSAQNATPSWIPDENMNTNTPDLVSGRGYGITKWKELFTDRQLTTLAEYCRQIANIRAEIEEDAISAGLPDDHISLDAGGRGALAYSEAIIVYLSFGLSRLTNIFNAFCRWESSREQALTLFSRQAIPMIWDFAENNPFAKAAGDFTVSLGSIVRVLENFTQKTPGYAKQFDAQSDCGLRGIMISTDPPYYDNIAYADLSDFFYIWLRKNLQNIYPEVFDTLLVPKQEELTAIAHRFDGDAQKAKTHFEEGMLSACKNLYLYANDDIPVTIYYAYKQSDNIDESETNASTGWETMLSAVINAGFTITGTWPIRTEMANRQIASGTNALASSIVLVCRKRSEEAQQITRRNLINILRRDLRPALKKLQESNIAPVDLAQSAIGPGMGVFSRYKKVLEADGTPMSVRSALQIINEEIDLYFNEQVGDLDAMSRFCVDLYTQNAFNDIKFGDADILARAKGTSVAALSSHDVVYAKAGTVHLIERTELPEKIDTNESCIWMLTQQLTQAMATGGVEACAKAVFMMFGSNAERAKDLAYRLYTIAEQKKWSTEAYAYNALVVAWPDIQSRAAVMQRETPEQLDMFSMGLLNT